MALSCRPRRKVEADLACGAADRKAIGSRPAARGAPPRADRPVGGPGDEDVVDGRPEPGGQDRRPDRRRFRGVQRAVEREIVGPGRLGPAPPPGLGERGEAGAAVPPPDHAGVAAAAAPGHRLRREARRLGEHRGGGRGAVDEVALGHVGPVAGRVAPERQVLRQQPAGQQRVGIAEQRPVGVEPERGLGVRRGRGRARRPPGSCGRRRPRPGPRPARPAAGSSSRGRRPPGR